MEVLDKEFLKQYQEKLEADRTSSLMDGTALALLLRLKAIRVIICTTTMAQAYRYQIEHFATHAYIDEAGILPFSALLTLVTCLGNLKVLLLTGDTQQLPPHMAELPASFGKGGLKVLLLALHEAARL